jgi:hypothetical protein
MVQGVFQDPQKFLTAGRKLPKSAVAAATLPPLHAPALKQARAN